LSRNKEEVCQVKKSSIHIASGVHELLYIAMTGRVLVDLYNYFRREYNLPSYKLDNVASHFIGDFIKDFTYNDKVTTFISKDLMGLTAGNYVRFEEIGHSTELYAGGRKFIVTEVNAKEGLFSIKGRFRLNKNKKLRWCLAKDDVTPQDIFRLAKKKMY